MVITFVEVLNEIPLELTTTSEGWSVPPAETVNPAVVERLR